MNPFANIGNIFLFRCVGACFFEQKTKPEARFYESRAQCLHINTKTQGFALGLCFRAFSPLLVPCYFFTVTFRPLMT